MDQSLVIAPQKLALFEDLFPLCLIFVSTYGAIEIPQGKSRHEAGPSQFEMLLSNVSDLSLRVTHRGTATGESSYGYEKLVVWYHPGTKYEPQMAPVFEAVQGQRDGESQPLRINHFDADILWQRAFAILLLQTDWKKFKKLAKTEPVLRP